MSKRVIKPNRITARWLLELGACKDEVQSFKEMFPGGAAVTVNNYLKVEGSSLDLEWFFEQLPLSLRSRLDRFVAKLSDKWGEQHDELINARNNGKLTQLGYFRKLKQLDRRHDLEEAKYFVQIWSKWQSGKSVGKRRKKARKRNPA